MYRIAALDTSTDRISLALYEEGELIWEGEEEAQQRWAEALFPFMVKTFQAVGWKPDQVARWGVGIGPGSFSGTRAGIAAVKGVALATGASVCGVTRFEAYLWGEAVESEAVFLLSAGRGEWFAAVGSAKAYQRPCHLREDELVVWVEPLIKNGFSIVSDVPAPPACLRPHLTAERWKAPAPHLARWIGQAAAAGEPAPLALLEPLYLKAPSVTPSKNINF